MDGLNISAVNLKKLYPIPFEFNDVGSVRLLLEPKNTYRDAAKTLKCSNNDACYTFADTSGNLFDFTQSVLANRPTFKTGGRNGNPYLRFTLGASGNAFLGCSSRTALKCLHDGTGGSIYIVADIPYATANASPGVIISSNALLDTNVGFSVPTDLSVDFTNMYSRFEVTNGTTKIAQPQLYLLNNEFRVITARAASAFTPDINMRGDADIAFSPVDASDVIAEANYSGTPSSANAGADITIGEVGVDTGGYCIMDLYLIVVFNEYLSDANHNQIINYLKGRFNLPQYEII